MENPQDWQVIRFELTAYSYMDLKNVLRINRL